MGIQSFFFYEFCAEFRRQTLFLYPPPSCGATALRLVYPLHAPIADPALIVVLQSITWIHIARSLSSICPRRVPCFVYRLELYLFRKDLDIDEGATMRRSGESASVFHESTTGANGRSAARGRRRTSIDIIPEAVANGFHC